MFGSVQVRKILPNAEELIVWFEWGGFSKGPFLANKIENL
jgi:hypothetical protein